MSLDETLLELLACPVCKGAIAPCPDHDGLRCAACGVVYPVREGIPVMLAEESVPEDQWQGSR